MQEQDFLKAAAALFNAFTWNQLVPLVTIVVLAGLFLRVLHQAQQREDFDASNFLRDERGKESIVRIFMFICCMTHTWAVITRTLSNHIVFEEFILYCLTWSGSAVLVQALDTLRSIRLGIAPPGAQVIHPVQPQHQQPPGDGQ